MRYVIQRALFAVSFQIFVINFLIGLYSGFIHLALSLRFSLALCFRATLLFYCDIKFFTPYVLVIISTEDRRHNADHVLKIIKDGRKVRCHLQAKCTA